MECQSKREFINFKIESRLVIIPNARDGIVSHRHRPGHAIAPNSLIMNDSEIIIHEIAENLLIMEFHRDGGFFNCHRDTFLRIISAFLAEY